MKKLLQLLLILLLLLGGYAVYKYRTIAYPIKDVSTTYKEPPPPPPAINVKKIRTHAATLKQYALTHHASTKICFFIDMSLPSGKNRFFVYDLQHDSIKYAGLVAHGCGSAVFSNTPVFSNKVNSSCSSLGRYKVSYSYAGRFGQAFKLNGLDTSNSNAFDRSVVLHAYGCVPDNEPYPLPICNSRGCPMVSYRFLDKLSKEITTSKQPILLWMYQ